MKITMVGTSGSGKTVFSAGIFATFTRREYEGFSIWAPGANFSDVIRDTHKFEKDYRMLAQHKWPHGTAGISHYQLELLYKGEKKANFDWIDYRGGFLDEPTLDNEQTAEVHANIAASNAVILFADAQKLVESCNPDEAAFNSGADAIMQILMGYARDYPDAKLTFLIALTKCDAIPREWKSKNYDRLVKHGIRTFEPLKDIIERNGNWRGGIIPTSTMGDGNVNSDGDITGFPKPFNISSIIAFCTGSILRHDQEDINDHIKQIESKKDEIEAKYMGFFGAIKKTFKIFNGSKTDNEVLKDLRREMEEDYNRLQSISQVVERLEEMAEYKVGMLT